MDVPAELTFFNALSGTLQIDLTEAVEPLSANLPAMSRAPAAARVKDVRLKARVFLEEVRDFRDLTPGELDSIAFRGPAIVLRGEAGEAVSHAAPDGKAFTVRDLLAAVEQTERQTRGQTDWFEGVDVHHIYFEGIRPQQDGSWTIFWGS